MKFSISSRVKSSRLGKDVNLTGVFYGIQCAARYMREKKYGKIINISSTSALGNAGQLNYSATKAGVIGMTKTAAKELGPKNVNVIGGHDYVGIRPRRKGQDIHEGQEDAHGEPGNARL